MIGCKNQTGARDTERKKVQVDEFTLVSLTGEEFRCDDMGSELRLPSSALYRESEAPGPEELSCAPTAYAEPTTVSRE